MKLDNELLQNSWAPQGAAIFCDELGCGVGLVSWVNTLRKLLLPSSVGECGATSITFLQVPTPWPPQLRVRWGCPTDCKIWGILHLWGSTVEHNLFDCTTTRILLVCDYKSSCEWVLSHARDVGACECLRFRVSSFFFNFTLNGLTYGGVGPRKNEHGEGDLMFMGSLNRWYFLFHILLPRFP